MHEVLTPMAPAHLGPPRHPAGERLGAAVGDDPPAVEDQDAVGQLLGLVEIVRRQQDRGVLQVRQPVHQVVEPAAGKRVEPRGGFVVTAARCPPLPRSVRLLELGPSRAR